MLPSIVSCPCGAVNNFEGCPELASGSLLPYNQCVGHSDVIIAGGGIIGLTLALELRKRGASVLVADRGEPGHEASRAAGGMLVDCMMETPAALQGLASASARMYPEFGAELEQKSGMRIDLRDAGTIMLLSPDDLKKHPGVTQQHPLPAALDRLEPSLASDGLAPTYFAERSVDPRGLVAAAYEAAKRTGVTFPQSSRDGGECRERSRVRSHNLSRILRFRCRRQLRRSLVWSDRAAPFSHPPGERPNALPGRAPRESAAACHSFS